jgi:hypothetical protein
MQANTDTVHDELLRLNVGLEVAVGSPLREAHIVAKRLGLATYVTFTGHGGPPFTKKIPPRNGCIRRATLVAIAVNGMRGA